MNIIVKSAVAGALGLAASSAFAISLPSSGSSDLVLIVAEYNSSGTDVANYALDTNIKVGSELTGPFVAGTQLNTTLTALGATIAASSTLTGFLNANSGDTTEWTLEGAQYTIPSGTGASSSNVRTAGLGEAVFTSQLGTNNLAFVTNKGLSPLVAVLNGVNNDLTDGGLSALQTSTETTAATLSLGDPSKNGFFTSNDYSAPGTSPITLFGFTGNGGTGNTQSYILGSVTFSSTGNLVITGNSTGGGTTAVPVPPAVWLFGSGVLGLVGVSRRRKLAV
jgi:hypothetical protein